MSLTENERDKPRYHHGNLAKALVDAATRLVQEKGPAHFSMADASSLAGVSKGAPYRHFESKDALLAAVIDSAFERFADQVTATVARYPRGTDDSVTAIGVAYLHFATSEPAIFKLMFSSGVTPEEPKPEHIRCFGILLSEISARTGLTEEKQLLQVARPLWTLVHGASMLTIDKNYQKVDPEGDTEQMIRGATELMLSPFTSPG